MWDEPTRRLGFARSSWRRRRATIRSAPRKIEWHKSPEAQPCRPGALGADPPETVGSRGGPGTANIPLKSRCGSFTKSPGRLGRPWKNARSDPCRTYREAWGQRQQRARDLTRPTASSHGAFCRDRCARTLQFRRATAEFAKACPTPGIRRPTRSSLDNELCTPARRCVPCSFVARKTFEAPFRMPSTGAPNSYLVTREAVRRWAIPGGELRANPSEYPRRSQGILHPHRGRRIPETGASDRLG